MESLKSSVLGLSARERAELAHLLIASLDEGTDADAHAAWDRELERRRQQIEAGKEPGIPADQVFREIRQRHS